MNDEGWRVDMSFFGSDRKEKAGKLIASTPARRIRIHSVAVMEEEDCRRIAFEFLDPPGPWSMQFYEARIDNPGVLEMLKANEDAGFHESSDGAQTRVLVTKDGDPVYQK